MRSHNSRKLDPILPFPDVASLPEKIAATANEEDWKFRRLILNRLPSRLAVPVANQYVDLHNTKSRKEANLYLLDVDEKLSSDALSISSNDDDLCAYAKKAAKRCASYRRKFKTEKEAYLFLVDNVRKRYKIDIPMFNIFSETGQKTYDANPVTVTGTDRYCYRNSTNNKIPSDTDTVTENHVARKREKWTPEGVLNRLCDENWWRRIFRKITAQEVEKYSISLGLVHRKKGIYISDESMQRYSQQKRRHRKSLEKITLTNEVGDEYSLQELIDLSVANPKNRRNELMVRIRGTEELSKELGDIGMFYTITCPSRMHPRLALSGEKNPKFDGTSPQQSQKYLTTIWAQIRAQLARNKTPIYGFRVVEPHHDATPHWHLLLFVKKQHADSITEVMRQYALREDPDEKGASEHRFIAIKVDPKKGSATGYIAKYISKSIDGYGVDDDLYGNDAKDSAKRIVGWASLWKVRQFQQIGGPPVTLYRELRRIKGDSLTGLMYDFWYAADKKNWQSFTNLIGGSTASRKDHPIKIARIWSDKPNKYLEPKGYEIIGVHQASLTIPTRLHTWSVTFQNSNEYKDVDSNNQGKFKMGLGL